MIEEAPRTQFPVNIDRPRASGARYGSIIVTRDGADAVREVNRCIASINDVDQRSNPDATKALRVTDMISVSDLGHRAYHSIHLHRLDPRPAVDNVIVFSEPEYAPHRTENLQLATPGYYRKQDDLVPGIRDQHDGTLTRDGSRWATSIMGGTVSAILSFVSSDEPWVYCASHYRFGSDLRRLRRNSTTATAIPSRPEFLIPMPSPRGSVSTLPSAWIRSPTSRLIPSTRSATRIAATPRVCGKDPTPSTPSSTSTTGRSTMRTCPAASTGRNTFSTRMQVQWLGSPKKPPSRGRASTASRSRHLALPCDRDTTSRSRRSCEHSLVSSDLTGPAIVY